MNRFLSAWIPAMILPIILAFFLTRAALLLSSVISVGKGTKDVLYNFILFLDIEFTPSAKLELYQLKPKPNIYKLK